MSVVRLICVVVAPVLLAGGLLAGCTVTGTVYAQREERQTIPAVSAPLVVVDTFNGRITVTAGGESAIDVRVTSRGSGSDQKEADQDLAKVAVTITSTTDRVTITARRTDQPVSLGDSGADVEISVPPESNLQLRTSNGRIEAANTSGAILARASNGAITTRGGHDLDLDTTNGPVSVNLATGKLRVRTSNGALDVNAAKDAQVTAETSNATLTFSGSLAPGSNTFETSNANLTLTLPGAAAFTIDGATNNGRVQTDFPRLEVSDTAIRGTAGISSVTNVSATTSNGDLAVMQQRP